MSPSVFSSFATPSPFHFSFLSTSKTPTLIPLSVFNMVYHVPHLSHAPERDASFLVDNSAQLTPPESQPLLRPTDPNTVRKQRVVPPHQPRHHEPRNQQSHIHWPQSRQLGAPYQRPLRFTGIPSQRQFQQNPPSKTKPRHLLRWRP
jgi:hypothetical protein